LPSPRGNGTRHTYWAILPFATRRLRNDKKLVGKAINQTVVGAFLAPGGWNRRDAIVCPGELAVHGAGGVGVVSQFDGEECPVPKGLTLVKGPKSRL
jgi:hypothetical protein